MTYLLNLINFENSLIYKYLKMDKVKMNKAIYELIGTFLLVSSVVLGATTSAGLGVVPIVYFLAIAWGGPISEGHFNPAVTLSLEMTRKKEH